MLRCLDIRPFPVLEFEGRHAADGRRLCVCACAVGLQWWVGWWDLTGVSRCCTHTRGRLVGWVGRCGWMRAQERLRCSRTWINSRIRPMARSSSRNTAAIETGCCADASAWRGFRQGSQRSVLSSIEWAGLIPKAIVPLLSSEVMKTAEHHRAKSTSSNRVHRTRCSTHKQLNAATAQFGPYLAPYRSSGRVSAAH